MRAVDLHTHSIYSDDGSISVLGLRQYAKEAGLYAIAVTDHNMTGAFSDIEALKDEPGPELIGGIEVDTYYKNADIHLLGYFIDPKSEGIREISRHYLEEERSVAKKRVERAWHMGFRVDRDKLFSNARMGIVNGEMICEAAIREDADNPLIAPYLKAGSRGENAPVNFYWDWCARGKPLYIPVKYTAFHKAVAAIREAGGVCVIAHPGHSLSRADFPLEELLSHDIAGLEVYSSYHDRQTTEKYAEAAKKYGLIATCGSDFHGKAKPAVKMGCVAGDYAIVEELKRRI